MVSCRLRTVVQYGYRSFASLTYHILNGSRFQLEPGNRSMRLLAFQASNSIGLSGRVRFVEGQRAIAFAALSPAVALTFTSAAHGAMVADWRYAR